MSYVPRTASNESHVNLISDYQSGYTSGNSGRRSRIKPSHNNDDLVLIQNEETDKQSENNSPYKPQFN